VTEACVLVGAVLFTFWMWKKLDGLPSFASIDEKFRRERERE